MVERRTENPYVGGSIPPQGTTARRFAGVAQLAEQLICNQQVVGSIPITSSKNVTPFLRGKKLNTGGLQSGQMHQTVNLTSPTSVVRIHLLPPRKKHPFGVLFSWWEEVLSEEANRSTERSEGLPKAPACGKRQYTPPPTNSDLNRTTFG